MRKTINKKLLDNLQRNSVCVIFKPENPAHHIMILEELVTRRVSNESILTRNTLEHIRNSTEYPIVYMSKKDFDRLSEDIKARVNFINGDMIILFEEPQNISKTTFSIKIEDKEYSKEELIKEVLMRMSELEDGVYASTPDDYDNFYSSYSFKKI